MRLDKVVLRAMLSTIASIAILFVIFIVFSLFFFPVTLMNLSYNLGMDNSAQYYANRAYRMSDQIEYAVFAFDIAVNQNDDEEIVKYGEKVASDDEFDEYCILRDEEMKEAYSPEILAELPPYRQYVKGNLYAAMYREGDKQSALDGAFLELENECPRGNAVLKVLLSAIGENDQDSLRQILLFLQEKQVSNNYNETDLAFLHTMIEVAERYCCIE